MKVLFVCTGNSFRSPVAEAVVKAIRHDIYVESAGTRPAEKIASNARSLLEEEHAAEHLKNAPEGIAEKSLEEYDLIVVMKEDHKREILRHWPRVEAKIEVWDIDDPICLPPGADAEIFREIKEKVERLAASLKAR